MQALVRSINANNHHINPMRTQTSHCPSLCLIFLSHKSYLLPPSSHGIFTCIWDMRLLLRMTRVAKRSEGFALRRGIPALFPTLNRWGGGIGRVLAVSSYRCGGEIGGVLAISSYDSTLIASSLVREISTSCIFLRQRRGEGQAKASSS